MFLPALALSINNLIVDPLMVYEAAEVWSVVASKSNPVWPGWNAATTPILIYLPNRQDLLINHPKPPEGFVPYTGPVRFPGATSMMIKDGKTLIDFDGQNTSRDVNGVQTLVVADTLSGRRQWMLMIAGSAKLPGFNANEMVNGGLQADVYDAMLMFAHEAFHVYQYQKAPNKAGSEGPIMRYPALDVTNNVGFALESEALAEALRAPNDASMRQAAIRWLAIRQHRRKGLKPDAIAYEDAQEFNEGLAKFVEYKMMQVLEKHKPGANMWLVQGFHGYDDLSGIRDRMIEQMVLAMSGKTNVNGDPYGASPVRFRLYFSGMGIAALLDRLGAKWQEAMLQPETTLTGLATKAMNATPAELDSAYATLSATSHFGELTTIKQTLNAEGQKHIAEVLDGFDQAPFTVVFDYSAIQQPKIGLSFTPFGVLVIDEDRTVFRILPIRGIIGTLQFAEDDARPVLQNRKAKTLTFAGTAPIDQGVLDSALAAGRDKGELQLPGISISGIKGKVTLDGKVVRVEVLP